MSPDRVETVVEGKRLTLSNLAKVLFPEVGFTKGALLDYYRRVAPAMLPHLAGRAATFRRFPDGVEGKSFFEKHVPRHAPSWVRVAHVPHLSEGGRGRDGSTEVIDYAVVDDLPTLIWAANLASIEIHVPLWRVRPRTKLPAQPDHLVFDLDPGPGTTIVECCTVARWLVERGAREGLPPLLAKTSGSKGLQLYAPLSRRQDWEQVRATALESAQAVEAEHPELVVSNMRKALREGRILIDWSQNHPAKTTVAAYSVRARPEPTVSTPVAWEEVEACEREADPRILVFRTNDVLERLERLGDLFAPLSD